MRKLVSSLVLLGLAAGAVAAVATAGAGRQSATFKFCTDPTFPPMEYATTSGKIIGFDVEMATKLAGTFSSTAAAVKTAFPGLIPALNAKKCDAVISGIFVTPDRQKQAGVVAYMRTHRVLIVKAGNPKKIHSPNQLKGLTVAVQAGTKYEEYLKALKSKIGFTLQSYPGDNDAVAQVLLGRADAVLTQDTSYAYQAKQHPGKIAVGFTFAASDKFGIYYRKGDAGTIGGQIKSGVAQLKSDGTLVKLATKYKIPVNTVK
jgi:polar amino acid transport system substrate-binding protein